MSLYAIGDIQGCFNDLEALLIEIDFSPDKDELWFTGDLVNRGPQSLETLRYIKQLGNQARCVLGNHDIHLIKAASGLEFSSMDNTMEAILNADDKDLLIDWLRHQPLFIFEPDKKLAMVHAGLLPSWDFSTAKTLAGKVEQRLQRKNHKDFLNTLNNESPAIWHRDMGESEQLQAVINAMTRIRFCDQQERMALSCKAPPGKQDAKLKPWFEWPHQRRPDITVVIGHWAAMGFRRCQGLLALDTGCVWGNQLTAYRLDPGHEKRFSVDCEPSAAI